MTSSNVGRHTAVSLVELLLQHGTQITNDWLAVLEATGLRADPLAEHIPALLTVIARDAADLARGTKVAPPRDDLFAGLARGFDLPALVGGLALLRESCLRVWHRLGHAPPPLDDEALLHRRIDQAIVAAIQRYIDHRDGTTRALDAVSNAALEAKGLSELLPRLLEVVLRATEGADAAGILLKEGELLRPHVSVGLAGDELGGILAGPVGQAFAGTIAAERVPLDVRGTTGEPGPLGDTLRRLGFRALHGVPLIAQGELWGVAYMGSLAGDVFSNADVRIFGLLAGRIATAIEQHALRQAIEQRAVELATTAEQWRFLDDAGRALTQSLELDDTLARVVQLSVQELADWCMVELREADDRLTVAAVAGRDREREAMARNLVQSIQPERRELTREVVRSGKARLLARIPETLMARVSHDDATLAAVKSFSIRSLMLVPMAARGRVIGVLMFLSSEPQREYGERDLWLAQELASRAALAVDNARLYHESRQATRMRDETLAVVSHDLKNPLGAIGLTAQHVRQEAESAGNERLERRMLTIQRAVERMDRLIHDLVDTAAIPSGRLALQKKPQVLRQLLADAIDAQLPLARQRGVRLACTACDEGVVVTADRERLLQVLSNLIGNALNFCRPGDMVRLEATVLPNEVRIAVRDTGPGVSPADVPRLFDAYWTSQAAAHGTGLGLYISRGIVEAHGGRIWYASEPGWGATFYFTLPLNDVPPNC